MTLQVKLTIVPTEAAKDQEEAMANRADLPAGVVIEDKTKKETEATEEKVVDLNASMGSLDLELPEGKLKGGSSQGSIDTGSMASLGRSLGAEALGKPSNEFGDTFYAMKIESTGKYSRKAELDDIARFSKVEKVDSDKLKEWLRSYLEQNFPEKLEIPNCIPRTAHIKDDPKKGFEAFGPHGWKVIKLNLIPGLIDVDNQWTKEVVLEKFELDYSTDLETALKEKGDNEVVSSLRKGPMKGHPLALGLFKKGKKDGDSQIVTEFRIREMGNEEGSTVFQLGNDQAAGKLDEETGDMVWKDVKKLRAVLHGKPLPKKTGKGVSRTVEVLALESYMKARVYYKASFTGSVTTDHGNEQYAGQRYWNWDLKYLLRYNGVPNAIVMHQDIELKFFSQVQYKMDNEDWEWVNSGGAWIKQKLDKPSSAP